MSPGLHALFEARHVPPKLGPSLDNVLLECTAFFARVATVTGSLNFAKQKGRKII